MECGRPQDAGLEANHEGGQGKGPLDPGLEEVACAFSRPTMVRTMGIGVGGPGGGGGSIGDGDRVSQ